MKSIKFGIISLELYTPKYYIDQNKLEEYLNYSKGKITIGLGQDKMSVTHTNEDSASMGLSVLKKLLIKENLNENKIGRLEFGTESLFDKSKSAKTILMDLFPNNKDIEGVTTINACYGGTAAIFNSLSWLESSQWDGRLAIVVMSDIALYKENNTLPTGGAGAIAILLGPNPNITFEIPRSSNFVNEYDFYKPDLSSEYPIVDGKISINCYYESLIKCYDLLKKKYALNSELINLEKFDSFIFHCPFSKQVEKSFLRLCHHEILEGKYLKNENNSNEILSYMREKPDFNDRKTITRLKNIFIKSLNNKINPSLYLSKQIGNIYTGSLYLCLISNLINNNNNINRRILMFSYGSGSASSMFIVNIKNNINLKYINNELNNRIEIDCKKYFRIREDRIYINNVLNFGKSLPLLNKSDMWNGSYYLYKIDNLGRRFYKQNIIDNILKINKTSNINKELIDNKILRKNNFQFSKFHTKNVNERINILCKTNFNINEECLKDGGLTLEHANLMIENCIGKLSLPMGLATNFKINDKYYNIPMVIEEPSVIAAASSIGKFVSDNGGFKATSNKSYVIGQIQILNLPNYNKSDKLINKNKEFLINLGNKYCTNLVKRGGGIIDIKMKNINIHNKYKQLGSKINNMAVIEILVDTCEAMGANTVNTITENLSKTILNYTEGEIGIRILSNSSPDRLAISKFYIPIDKMSYKGFEGKEVSKRIINSYIFADNDIFRASTHNKGIMNGVDAVSIACGQDWRAIEAGVHSYFSSINKKYGSLTDYKIINKNGIEYFQAKIELPLMIGVKGGVLGSNLQYSNNLNILGNPDTRELMTIMASVGLAQNFGALRAMVTEGIQKGHMKLQAKHIAIRAGIPPELVNDCVKYMNNLKSINIKTAREFYNKIN